jgi:hypothetical protein
MLTKKGPVCEKVNCLRCNIIHMAKTCKEYQDELKIAAINDENAQKDIKALEVSLKFKFLTYFKVKPMFLKRI